LQNSINKTADNWLQLLNNKTYIEQKRKAYQWVLSQFEELATAAELQTQGKLPAIFSVSKPKISKGEAHEGLPFIVLDYPAWFDKENIVAIRTIFVWGEPIQITLLIKGRFVQQLAKQLSNYAANNQNKVFISMAESPWFHLQEKANWKKLDAEKMNERLHQNQFIKLGVFCELNDWANLHQTTLETFNSWLSEIYGNGEF
jgi:hypothetical protein